MASSVAASAKLETEIDRIVAQRIGDPDRLAEVGLLVLLESGSPRMMR